MMMLDLFAGRLGWAKAFIARGWKAVCVDLVQPPEIPEGVIFRQMDVSSVNMETIRSWEQLFGEKFLFACASSPCEKFSVHGMKHFHPNPPYPDEGIRLFEHTRSLLEWMEIPYCMENVRAAQQFVGRAVHHCGPFYLWGTGVPAIMPQGIVKGLRIGSGAQMRKLPREEVRAWRKQYDALQASSRGSERHNMTAKWATIPPELANAVASYAERLLEMKVGTAQ